MNAIFPATRVHGSVTPKVHSLPSSDHWCRAATYCARDSVSDRRGSVAGFTLLELMIAVAIVALLAAIAYPSYQSQIRKARRSVAKTALVDVASREEQHFQNNKTFTSDLTALGYATDPFYLDKDGQGTGAASASRIYEMDITEAAASTFTVEAIPQLGQAGDSCGTLTLNQAGTKDATGPVSECW